MKYPALTLDPICVHLDDLVYELDGQPPLPLGVADLLRVPALAVDELQYVQSHRVVLVSVLGG